MKSLPLLLIPAGVLLLVLAATAAACGSDGQEPMPAPAVNPSEELATPGSPEEELLSSMLLTGQEVDQLLPGQAWTEAGVFPAAMPEEQRPAGQSAALRGAWSGGEELHSFLGLYGTADAASGALKDILAQRHGEGVGEGVEVDEFDLGDIGDEAKGRVNRTPEVYTFGYVRVGRVLADIMLAGADGERRDEVQQVAQKLAEKIEAEIES
jgi:hypothetical protein